MEKLFGMQKMENMTDLEFAKYLKAKDPNWTWDSINDFNRFMAHGKVVAVVKYHNSYPVGRVIWVEIEKKVKKEREKTNTDGCPECGRPLKMVASGVRCDGCGYAFCF